MKKAIGSMAIIVLLSLLLTGCCLSHDWVEATCTAPKTCLKCEKTEGELLPHDWQDATCTASKTCSNCEATEGDALGHSWIEATCETAKTCMRCGTTEGSMLGHTWVDATCIDPQICATCGITSGDALGHSKGEWKIATEPEDGAAGVKTRSCVICDYVLETEEFFYPYFDMSFEEFMKKHNETYSSQGWTIEEVPSGFEFYMNGKETAIIFHDNLNYLVSDTSTAFSTKKWEEFNIIQVRLIQNGATSVDTEIMSTVTMLGAAITQPLFNYDLNAFLEEFIDTWAVTEATDSYVEGFAIIDGCKFTIRARVSDFSSAVYYEWLCQTI